MRTLKRAIAGAAVCLGLLGAPAAAHAQDLDKNHPTRVFEHSMWQWYQASDLSAERRAAIASHFPEPEITEDADRDLLRYNQALLRWTYLYPHEYEAFVNAPELTALNPYYQDYVPVYRRPRFMDVAITADKPELPRGDSFEDGLYLELQLMKWMFVFHPDSFHDVYGFTPRMPEDVDVQRWRDAQRQRATERTSAALSAK